MTDLVAPTGARTVAEIQSVPDAVGVMTLARAAKTFADSPEKANLAAGEYLKAGLALVELVDAGQAAGTIATPLSTPGGVRNPDTRTLDELGVKRQRLAEMRLLVAAGLTPERIDELVGQWTRRQAIMPVSTLHREARDYRSASEKERVALAAASLPDIPEIDLRVGDFRQVLSDVREIDAIITDPPYGGDSLHLLADLAAFADAALTEDGVLAVLFGQTHLPTALSSLSVGRPYRWMLAYLTPGAGYVSHAREVQSNWKPVLLFGAGPRIGDVIQSSGDDKRHHEWGQDAPAFIDLVERLTLPGMLVCDPFLGGGTTAVAARNAGRGFVGCDIDEQHVLSTRARLAA